MLPKPSWESLECFTKWATPIKCKICLYMFQYLENKKCKMIPEYKLADV